MGQIDLITRSKHNDGNAFRQLVELNQQMVYFLAYSLLCNEEEARDAVQETFIKVWLNLKKFDTNRKFSTWVYTIATNLCYDKLNSGKHFSKCLPAEALNEVLSDEDVEKKMIDAELGVLLTTLNGYFKTKAFSIFWETKESPLKKQEKDFEEQEFVALFTKAFNYQLCMPGRINLKENIVVSGDTLTWKLTAYRMLYHNPTFKIFPYFCRGKKSPFPL